MKAGFAASLKNLEVLDVASQASTADVAKARTAFAQGDAIIRMAAGSPADFKRLFGVSLGNFHAFSQTSKIPGAGIRKQLKLQGIAAYRDEDGILRSVLSFAPDGSAWQKPLDDWIAREQSKALGFVKTEGLLGDDPEKTGAWTLLYSATFQAIDAAGFMQSTDAMYRLNATKLDSDVYLVTTVPETVPFFSQAGGVCDGIARCDWHTIERDFSVSGNGAQLIEHGPTGTITSSTTGFTITGNVGPTGPGVSAGFSSSWSTPSMVTTDSSDAFNGSWKEAVTFSGVPCVPVVGTIPGVSTGTFQSEQAAIFKVVGGASNISFPMTQKTEFCAYYAPPWDPPSGLSTGVNYQWITIDKAFPLLGRPVLQAFPKNLTIPPGGSRPLVVDAYIPNSDQGLPWTIKSNTAWLTVPSSDKYSTSQVIPVTVAIGTPEGATAQLSIDTDPSFAAPSVVSGAIIVNVTVGTPKAGPTAGVLISGGHDTGEIVNPYFYNLITGDVVPLTPVIPRTATTATLLKTGNVLVAAGATNYSSLLPPNTPTNTAELFQPGQLTFSSTGSLSVARMNHSATLLDDGKVLVVGGTGSNTSQLNSAELYDPATGNFSPAGTLLHARTGHHASLISQPGKPSQVVVYGGYSLEGPEQTWELWDETANGFTRSGPMAATAIDIPQPLPLTDGTLDLVGGWIQKDAQAVGQEQFLVPEGPTFSIGRDINVPRSVSALTALPNGDLLLTGGVTALDQQDKLVYTATAERRDSGGWSLLSRDPTCPGEPGCMLVARGNHTATLLPSGKVFIAGGENALGAIGQSELYDPVSGNFLPGPVTIPEFGHNATPIVTTETGLLATPASSAPFGTSVTLAATVTAAAGVPTGTVRFLDGQTVIGSGQLVQGQASINTTKLSIGSHTLTASYAGASPFISSTSAGVNFVIAGGASQTTLSASPNPADLQQPVTLTAVVSSTSGSVTGPVVFKDGNSTLGTANLNNGSAMIRVAAFSTGSHVLSASYAGNSQWGPSAGTTDLTVRAITTSKLQSSVNPSQAGIAVTFTVKVGASGSAAMPTGTVAFTDGNTSLGTAPLRSDGTSQFTTSALAAGTHAIVGAYSGDNNFAGSASDAFIQTVNPAAKTGTVTMLSSKTNPSASGTSVALTATVSPATSSSSKPTGSVTFTDQTTNTALGTAQVATVNGAQVALLSTNALTTAGAHLLVASYQGDANFSASSSAPYTQTVSGSGGGKVTPVVDLTVNGSKTGATVDAGSPVTFSVVIHAESSYPVPNGSITISDSTNANNRYGSMAVTKSPTSNDGVATIVTSSMPQGAYNLVATYGGDNQGLYYNGAQSNSVSLTVKPGVGTPPSRQSLSISAVTGAREGTIIPVSLTITNNGTAMLSRITLNQIVLRTLAGTGQALLAVPALPLTVGGLEPGASAAVILRLQVPEAVRRLAISESGSFQDDHRMTYAFNPGQMLFP